MRTQEEILQKIDAGFTNDVFGFGINDIIYALSFENAKQYLKEEFLSKESAQLEWKAQQLKSDSDVISTMRNYLSFAWDKANNERGLSADRSIQHFIAWAWLIDDEFSRKLETLYNTNYAPYGKPILMCIEEYLKKTGGNE